MRLAGCLVPLRYMLSLEQNVEHSQAGGETKTGKVEPNLQVFCMMIDRHASAGWCMQVCEPNIYIYMPRT